MGRRVRRQAARATELNSPGTVYTFAVGSKAPLPAFTKYQMEGLLSGVKYDPADVGRRNAALRLAMRQSATACRASRRAATSAISPMSAPTRSTTFKDIVFSGAFKSQGMPDFTGKLKDDDVVKIIAFIQGVADFIRPKDPAASGSK